MPWLPSKMATKWDPDRSAGFLRRLREDVERLGEPLASNISRAELTPQNLVIAGAGGMIITEDEHLVFVRRTDLLEPGDWLLTPGGEVEPGESPAGAFVREAKEETGLDVEVDTLAILFATDGGYVEGYEPGELGLWVQFIGYARGGRLNDCVDREDDIGEAVAIRCDEVDPARLWAVTDRLLLHYTACGPPDITRDELLAQFARLGRRWPPRLENEATSYEL